MWGSEKFVHLSTKQKNQWFKLRLWSKTEYLRMEGEDDRWVWISGVNHPKQRTVDRRDEEESAGRLDRVKRCCWDPPWWTVWRRRHWERTGGWAGDARTEQDYKYQGGRFTLKTMLQSQRKTTERGSRMQRRRLQDVGDAAETRWYDPN